MVLSNTEISNLITTSNLIEFHDVESIKNCSYKIRIGQLIEPETGNIMQLNGNSHLLKPSEIVIFQSIEKFHVPDNISASYSALFSISSKGVLLINSSMIEPGYNGYLSGVILNFSAQHVPISIDQEIAKVNFYKLNQVPTNIVRETIDDRNYISNLRLNATKYHKSFLNIGGIEKVIETNILGKVKGLLTTSGIIITCLIVFATLEPLLSRWIWEKTGVTTSTEKYKLEEVYKEIDKYNKDNNKLINLQRQVDSLKHVIKTTEKRE